MKATVKVVMAIMLLAAMPAVAPAQAPATAPKAARPDKAMPPESCATPECHGEVKSFKVVHGPVNVNACDACHKLDDAQVHTFSLSRQGGELCTFCHTVEVGSAPVVHKPVQDGQCISCHNPHGGVTKAMTRGATIATTCVSCHQDPRDEMRHVHGPVAAGGCDSCHASHTSTFPKLLNAQGSELCFTCHAETRQQLAQAKFPHKALEQDCGVCHDAHASNYRMQIRQAPLELCSSCHAPEGQAAAEAPVKHSVMTQDQSCLNCHSAHGGNLAQLMRDEPINVCMKCHEQKIDANGRTVAGVPEVLDPKLVKHGPIRDGNCSGCHTPHGGQNARLLSKPFPDAFYQGFALEKYELCFSCHDSQLVQAEKARGLTGFRNGERNLHFVHVNKEDRGRSCRACHSTHASGNALHVRDTVPYGRWEMPINFRKTDTGGSCSPGCHKPYEYDRDKPVDYSQPSPAPPASEQADATTARN